MIQEFNYHCHTKRCGHAIGEDEEYVLAAIQQGFQYIGFSDHAPYRFGHDKNERMDKEEFEEYIQSILHLQEKYKDQIEIRIGLECEFFKEQLDELLEYKDRLDYIILGQHEAALRGYSFYEDNSDEAILHYADLIEEACDMHFPDILAHPDLFMYATSKWTPACVAATRKICESAARNNIPLEVNLNGLRYGKKQIGDEYRYTYPYRKFWEIASEYPIKVVYGLDAHTPEKYADTECFRIVQDEILKGLKLDFIQHLTFEKKL